MKKTLLMATVLVMVSSSVLAQEDRIGLADFRIGGIGLVDKNPTTGLDQLSVGFKVGGYPVENSLDNPLGRRIAVYFAFDYLPVSRKDLYFPEFSDIVRFRQHGFLLTPGMSLDVVQSYKLDLSINLGLTFSADWKTVSLRNKYDEWENVCRFNIYRDSCSLGWESMGTMGAGIRYFPVGRGNLYLGMDANYYQIRKKQFLFTLGRRF